MKESSNGFPLACWFAKLNMLRIVSRSWTWIPLFDRLSPYFMAQTCSTCLSGPWLGPNRTQMYCMICMFHGFRRAKVHGVLPYVLYSSILYICISIYLVPSSSAPADPGRGLDLGLCRGLGALCPLHADGDRRQRHDPCGVAGWGPMGGMPMPGKT